MNALTKIICVKTGVALTLTFCGPNSQAELLVNPSFENASEFFPAHPSPPPSYASDLPNVNRGWLLVGQVGQADMSGGPDPALDGNYGLLEQTTAGNNWNPDVAYQIVSGVTPGTKYEFDISYMTTTGFSGSFYPNVGLEIGFLDSSLNDIGTVENPTPYGSFSYPIASENTWYRGSFSGTAPVGSTYVIVLFLFMDNGQRTTEDVYFDSASLSIVPEPSGFALISLGLAIPIFRRYAFRKWPEDGIPSKADSH